MENSYGIGVCNRYALFLNDESDPLEILKIKEQEKELKKKKTAAEKENKGTKSDAPAKGKQTPAAGKKPAKETKTQEIKDAKPQHRTSTEGKSDRNLGKFNENREERNNRRNREDRQFNGPSEGGNRDREERPPRREHFGGENNNFENRNRGGRPLINKEGTGGTRGGPKGRTFDNNRRGKREFDRQSGSDKTGIKSVDKRDGGGAHNWGSHKDVIEDVDKIAENEQIWSESAPKNDSGISTETKDNSTEAEPEATPEVEEPKELTLDEWKAQRAGRSKPQYNVRKAGEGEDLTQWKKMYVLKKKAVNEDESEEEEFDASEYPQRVGRQKHVLDIDIHFNDARRAGVGRGRGSRAGRGTRPNRGGGVDKQQRFRANDEQVPNAPDEAAMLQRNEKAPKVDDERDFPSLG